MTDTKLIAREPTNEMVDTAAMTYFNGKGDTMIAAEGGR